MHRIAADTAFFGSPVEAVIEDRALFCDLFQAYYTDVLGAYCWVARVDKRVAGYLCGCPDTGAMRRRWPVTTLPRVVARGLLGEYRLGARSLRFGRALFGAWLRQERTHVDTAAYPAHLHINVAAGWRGHGLGRRLMEAYLAQLRQIGVPGVHLNTTSANEAACALYEKMGFRLLQSHATALWRPWLGRLVQQRSYGLHL